MTRLKQLHLWVFAGCAALWIGWVATRPPEFHRPRAGISPASKAPGWIRARITHPPVVTSPQQVIDRLEDDPGYQNRDAHRGAAGLSFHFLIPTPKPDRFDAIRRFDPSSRAVTLPGGQETRLTRMVVAYAIGKDDLIRLRFDPHGRPDPAEIGTSPGIQVRPGQFSLTFVFALPDGVTVPDGAIAYNPETCRAWSTDVHSLPGPEVAITCRSYAWSDTPLTLAFDLNYGQLEQREIPFRTGARAIFRGLDFGILAIESGSWTMAYPAQTILECRKTGGQGSLLRLRVTSRQTWNPKFQTEFLDPNGAVLDFGTFARAGFELQNRFYALPAGASSISAIRVSAPPSIRDRVILQIPRLPGIPEPNRGVDNWFDCRIPYLEIENEEHFCQILSDAAQVDLVPSDVAYPFKQPSFPRMHDEVSIHELLAEWNRQTSGPRLSVHPELHLLHERPPWSFQETWKQWRRRLGWLP